jgi:hypothetical protein
LRERRVMEDPCLADSSARDILELRLFQAPVSTALRLCEYVETTWLCD